MSQSCRQIPDWLEQAREGRLSVPLRRSLSGHLQDCARCRELEAETEPLTLFAGLTQGPLPDGVGNYILGGLRVEEERQQKSWWSGPSLWPAMASLAAAAALLMFWAVGGTGVTVEQPGPWLEAHAMNDALSTVEDISSDTAEVFALSLPAAAGGSTEVILIVDRSIDL